jgi:hypothetical protein
MDAAVTALDSVSPTPYVPAETAENVPRCVAGTVPALGHVMEPLFVLVEAEAAFHADAWRA